jgi:hypothetical protein
MKRRLAITPSKPLGQIIVESVRGEHKAWPTDPAYSTGASHADGFTSGDRQRVLWQIYDSAVEGSPIPEWASKAFCDALVAVVTYQSTWEREFGEVPAKGPRGRSLTYQSKINRLAKYLIRVGEAIRKHNPKDDEMYEELRKHFGLDRKFLKECWWRYKLAHGLK